MAPLPPPRSYYGNALRQLASFHQYEGIYNPVAEAPESKNSLPPRVQFLQRTTQCPFLSGSCFFHATVLPISGSFSLHKHGSSTGRRSAGTPWHPLQQKKQTLTGMWVDFTVEQRWLTTCRIHPRRMLIEAWNMAKTWIGSQRDHVWWIALNCS